jgi:hypothetical protein
VKSGGVRSDPEMTTMVECRDGGMSPAIVACVHIADGSAAKFVALPAEGSEMHDYLCNRCFVRIGDPAFGPDDLITLLDGMREINATWEQDGQYGAWIDPQDLEDD